MTARYVQLLNVWDNPVFQRFRRSRLRARKAVFWYLLTLILTTFVVMMGYIVRTNSGVPEADAARSLWLPLLVIQGLILMVRGTGTVSSTLIQDRLDQTLDYQRLTPVAPLRNLVGYLFGLPVMEYVMVALTLPHLVFVVVVGRIPIDTVAAVYLAFMTCVVLYHITAISVGMVMQRWILGYLVGTLAVLFVNVVLPLIVSQFGLKFLQYLSVWPVIGQKLLPLLVASETGVAGNPFLNMADAVPFYNWSFSPFVFTLLLQGALIVTFTVIALRRWKNTGRHPLGKPYALVFLSVFIVLMIGNLWPALTRQVMPFAIFGVSDANQLEPVIAMALPMAYCVILWLLSAMLLSAVTPTHHSYLRGLRRAARQNRGSARPWEDDATNTAFALALTGIAVAGLVALSLVARSSGFLASLPAQDLNTWRLPMVFALLLAYTALLLQVLGQRPAVLAVLLVWLLPILVATLSATALRGAQTLQTVIASISPVALLLMTGVGQAGAEVTTNQRPLLTIGIYTGIGFLLLQIILLAGRWHQLSTGFRSAAQTLNVPPSGDARHQR